jgi:23S rRNA (guanosine2251-2'-O)-methyltransferase
MRRSKQVNTGRGEHRQSGQLYGVKPVLEALRAGNRLIQRVTIAENVRDGRLRELIGLVKANNIPLRRIPRAALDRLAVNAHHQGVVAEVAAARYADAEELLTTISGRVEAGEAPLVMALDGVEDPRNLGAILRTAECAGVQGVFLPERRAAGLTGTVAKTSAGAVEHLPIARVSNLALLVEELKRRSIWVVGTVPDAAIDHSDWDWTQPCAVLLGGEGAGLRRLLRERCDALVRIPMRGRIGSLNVAVAAGVVLFEAVRQRGGV